MHGRLDVAKWIFERGAATDISGANNLGVTPLRLSSRDVQVWLLLQGAASGTDGQVDKGTTRREVTLYARPALRDPLAEILNNHFTFTSLVLAAIRFGLEVANLRAITAVSGTSVATRTRKKEKSKQALRLPRGCALPLLRGHEDTLLRLIADFAGVVRGRQLRNAREATNALFAPERHCSSSRRGNSR